MCYPIDYYYYLGHYIYAKLFCIQNGNIQQYIAKKKKKIKREQQGSDKSRMQDRFGGWNLKALMMCCVHIINNVREILLSVPRIKSSPCPFYYTFLSLSWSRHSSSSQLGTRALIFKIFFPIVHVDHTFLNLIAQTACVSFTQRERERESCGAFFIYAHFCCCFTITSFRLEL